MKDNENITVMSFEEIEHKDRHCDYAAIEKEIYRKNKDDAI